MVSIMPGIENLAPERTETKSGSAGSPSFRPRSSSSRRTASACCSATSIGTFPPEAEYRVHVSVVTVNPGGTGTPAFVISASPAPLPPRTSRMVPVPSALPSPKKYTYFALISSFPLLSSSRPSPALDPGV